MKLAVYPTSPVMDLKGDGVIFINRLMRNGLETLAYLR
jgi:hypothetical protein